ncbi:GntR family transcriptional regulator [Mycolicibacter senuensis]|uniref:Putative transcriptional regulator, GntR family protein n=1 Tax=Mycolicibacter senuensis TaxID=386913 RepID=A0A7I9XG01_9MYCO|nr:GntR family transcriptional regulator [Mycolicibacter senuensis]ORW65341.1 GntR family transcriptional regulator [Mycolicibacter senuensis]GFG68882.1 putative transcriptional regulator, GntR family protein [Mycolicibacter senuensis]
MTLSHEAGFEPLSRPSTPELIAERLREAITRGRLSPGQQLGEAGLAGQFEVSRGPLREAMQRLVAEGLLRSERNRGIFVVELSDDDVRDVYQARKAIERAAVIDVLRGDPAAAAARLRGPVEALRAAAARGDGSAVADADQAFHEVLVDCAGSPRLLRAMRTLLSETRILLGELEEAYPDLREQVTEHVVLRKAIAAADEAAAVRLIDEHMDDAVRRLLARRAQPVL